MVLVLVAERSLLWFRASEWAALGTWFTGLATLGLVFFAVRQIRAAVGMNAENLQNERDILREQTRPYVVANLENRDIYAIISFVNIGRTPAFDVRVRMSQRFESTKGDALERWQHSPMFTSCLPMMAPTYALRFTLDSFPDRRDAGLDPVVAGMISYSDSKGCRYDDELFVIDLAAVGDGLQPDKTVHELVEQVSQIRRLVEGWGKKGSGLRVKVTNEDRAIARENRPMLISRAMDARKARGWYGYVGVWIADIRRRLGLHEFG